MADTPQAWRPVATPAILRQRAHLLHQVRNFFWQRGVMEVETPQLLPGVAPELHQDPIACQCGFLSTSPETTMKRLLAAGCGPVYQICRSFRAGEQGVLHNPEFTILEWYQPGWSYRDLMIEVESLLWTVLECTGWLARGGKRTRAECWHYREAFRHFAGVDPFTDSVALLRAACQGESTAGVRSERQIDPLPEGLDRQDLLDLLLLQQVEPGLKRRGGPVFLLDFPPEAAAMARIDPGPPAVAQRFELYMEGVELANGYQELTDPVEQQHRLLHTNQQRQQTGKQPLPIDERFLHALAHGLPACAGVAVGLDRLIMLALGANQIQEVMAFPWDPL